MLCLRWIIALLGTSVLYVICDFGDLAGGASCTKDGGAPLEVCQLWKQTEERKLSVTSFIVVPGHTGDFRIKVATPGRSFPSLIMFMVRPEYSVCAFEA
jgi:hypothetical protein